LHKLKISEVLSLLAGRAGCNWYSAQYAAKEHSAAITVTETVRTDMYCRPPQVMEQEQRYLASLDRWAGYRISGSTLIITDASGTTVAEFSRTG